MTLPSQFSLEEENFYKDIQDLLKNSSQNEKELSTFLQRYMDLLAKADLDDESLIINFTKAGLIIEASAKVYGTKVDRLWNNLENVLVSLRNKSLGQSKSKTLGGDEMEMEVDESRRRLSMNSRRRKKVGDALVSADDFVEIDNVTGLLGKNVNEDVSGSPGNLKFCEKVPNMFIKNKQRKKKIDVCLNKNVEEKDIIRLRDWIVSAECLLVKEICASLPKENSTNDEKSEIVGIRCKTLEVAALDKSDSNPEESKRIGKDVDVALSDVGLVNMSTTKEDLKDKDFYVEVEPEKSLKEPVLEENVLPPDKGADFSNNHDLNISRESDLAKFPNVVDRGPRACLVDVDEVFWDSEKFKDLIPSKKLRSGREYKTFNPPCKLCKHKEVHQGKKLGKRCMNKKKKESGLDSFFIPHVQPTLAEPQFGILPDEELISAFKQENKIIEQLAKVHAARNINEAFHPDENPEELKNFLGFDGFDKKFLRISECNEGEIEADLEGPNADEEPNFAGSHLPDDDYELPVPVTADLVKYSVIRTDCVTGSKDDDRLAESEYQKVLNEGLKDHYEAKSIFARNKELGMKISKWHEMISGTIKLSDKRGAMNMKSLANEIMSSFPSFLKGELPQMSFRELVKNQCRRDIPRYFFGCLQLTNEGNLNITRTDARPLATDCMVITQLRQTRKSCELDESTARTPTKEAKATDMNRKRNTLTRSPMSFENKTPTKTKRAKQRTEKAYKRQKNFTALNSSKKLSDENEAECESSQEQHIEWQEYEKEELLVAALHQEEVKEVEKPKKPKKTITLPSDCFQEVDISISLSGESSNDMRGEDVEEVKFYDNVFKMFVKNKTKKKRKIGGENVIRSKNWAVTTDCLLVKEIFASIPEHKRYGGNEGVEKESMLIDKDILLCSSEAVQSAIGNMGLERVKKAISKKSELAELLIFGRKQKFSLLNDHIYGKNQDFDCKSESLVSEADPTSHSLVLKDNSPGPSNVRAVQPKMKPLHKRQENFVPPSHPKKAKY